MSEYYAVQRSGEYLEHYGVKGMKWGVRRYQRRDGSLRKTGKKLVLKTAGYGYLNPSRKDVRKGNANERRKVIDSYVNAWNSAGAKNKSGYPNKNKDRSLWDSYKNSYASATLKDLGLANKKSAKRDVESVLRKLDPSYNYDGDRKLSGKTWNQHKRNVWKQIKREDRTNKKLNRQLKRANVMATAYRESIADLKRQNDHTDIFEKRNNRYITKWNKKLKKHETRANAIRRQLKT